MGDWFETIADVEATGAEADRLGAEILAWLVATGIVLDEPSDCVLGGIGYPPGPNYTRAVTAPWPGLLTPGVNGVEIITGRTVFHSMGVDTVTCPRCGQVVDHDDLSATVDTWFDGGGGDHRCPHCGEPGHLNDWIWSPPWGFGHLGIRFWNWPGLHPDFRAEVARRLGHRTVHPRGRM